MSHYSRDGDPSNKERCKMEVLETYTSVLVVLIGALLLVAAGLGKKQLVWKRPKPARARFRRHRP
jgi:Na+/serine symporter